MQNILKYLFPVPKEESKRVVTFANTDDYISFRFGAAAAFMNPIQLQCAVSDITRTQSHTKMWSCPKLGPALR